MGKQPINPRPQWRAPDVGVSLVEVLVVLALLGVMAGAISFGLGRQVQGKSIDEEAELLISRLNRAADHSLLSGQKMQLQWDEGGYRFLIWAQGDWQTHPIGILGTPYQISSQMRLLGDSNDQTFVVWPGLIPKGGKTLKLTLQSGDQGQTINLIFDGVTARLDRGAI